jgi:hypothetical protein
VSLADKMRQLKVFKDMRQQFLTELMRVFPNTVHRGDSKVKIILSCRSHHFEDLKAQSSFF